MEKIARKRCRTALAATLVAALSLSCTPAPTATEEPTTRGSAEDSSGSPTGSFSGNPSGSSSGSPTDSPTDSPTTGESRADSGFLDRIASLFFDISQGPMPCTLEVAPGSTSSVITVERLERVKVCVRGLRGASPPPVELTTPSGDEVGIPLTDGDDHASWTIEPGVAGVVGAVGRYGFRIVEPAPAPLTPSSQPPSSGSTPTSEPPTQSVAPSPTNSAVAPSARVTSGQLDVVLSEVRRLLVDEEDGTASVRLAGYPVDARVGVALYASDGPGETSYHFVHELTAIATDPSGEAQAQVSLPSTLEPGTYGLWTMPTPEKCVSQRCYASLASP